MNGLDNLLANSLEKVIRDNLGKKTIKKIEGRLFEKFGISITQSLREFHKLDAVLREYFGSGADGLEHEFMKNICQFEKSKDNSSNWITIEDQYLAKLILEAFGDEDKKLILNELIDKSCVTAEILSKCKLPQTSGYRKINSLIDVGFLGIDGRVITDDGKKVNKYRTVFRNVKINIIKDKIAIKVQLNKESLNQSTILQVFQNA